MTEQADRNIGRYVLFDEIAAGGMATVHLAKLKGPVGFSRTVAIKKLHPEYARDPQFVSMFLDEARLASRVRHPNVVPTLDIVTTDGQLYLVMEYVQGVSMAALLDATSAKNTRVPPQLVATIVSGALMGLHAAHEACDEEGDNLGIVHRDVSPSNILVGKDGMPRVLDFGVAKAAGRMTNTRGNVLKGTLGYIAPEQFNKEGIDRRADIYSASVMLWESLCGKPLFEGETEYAVIAKALFGEIPLPSTIDPGLAPFDAVVMKGLDREPDNRFDTAREMALAIENCVGTCSNSVVADWLARVAGDTLADRANVLAKVEGGKGRRTSEIRAAMLDALDLEDFDDMSPSASTTGGVPADPNSDTRTTAAALVRPTKKTSKLRVGLGALAAATAVAFGVIWMQTRPPSAMLEPVVQPPAANITAASAATVQATAPRAEPDPMAATSPSGTPTLSSATAAESAAPAATDAPDAGAPDASIPAPDASSPPPRWPRTWRQPRPPPKPPTPQPPSGKDPWGRDRFGQ